MRSSRLRLVTRAMSSAGHGSLQGMTDSTQDRTSVSEIGVAMFTVADQDAAKAFYTEKLGFEVRADVTFGEHGENRWLEVAPPGSTARLALNPPMGSQPGHAGIGVETDDVLAEHARLSAIGGIDLGNVREVLAAGAERIVVVRAIRDAADPRAAAAALRSALDEATPVDPGR